MSRAVNVDKKLHLAELFASVVSVLSVFQKLRNPGMSQYVCIPVVSAWAFSVGSTTELSVISLDGS